MNVRNVKTQKQYFKNDYRESNGSKGNKRWGRVYPVRRLQPESGIH